MTRRPHATVAVLTLRVVGSLTIVAAYAALRLPTLTSPWEAAATWVVAIVCGAVAIRSIERLAVQRRDALAPGEPSPLELTDVIPPVREWPDEVELVIAEARHEALMSYVDRGEVTEHLFTHDILCEPTPPRGFSMYPNGGPDPFDVSDNEDAIRYTTTEYVGRHRPEHIHRDRFGQLFGSF